MFLGAGQTGRTSAHLMPWYDDFYHLVEKDHGIEIAQLVADSYRKSIDWVEEVVKEENIECHFSRVNGYLFPHDESESALDTLNKVTETATPFVFYFVARVIVS